MEKKVIVVGVIGLAVWGLGYFMSNRTLNILGVLIFLAYAILSIISFFKSKSK